MMKQFAESGHPIFRRTSAAQPRNLEKKAGRNTIHSSAKSGNIKLLLRTINSLVESAPYLRSSIELV